MGITDEVGRCIGNGRTGLVLRAFDYKLGRVVAIKTYSRSAINQDKETFTNEEHMYNMIHGRVNTARRFVDRYYDCARPVTILLSQILYAYSR